MLLANYVNGNYQVSLYDDGTKVRYTKDSKFLPDFPESIDLKITNQCDLSCVFCHERAVPNGEHGIILGIPFYDTLIPGTELAIGGGNPLSHPNLEVFLREMKARGIVCNLTVNHHHLNQQYLDRLHDEGLIHGLGVSVSCYHKEVLGFARSRPWVVLHVINGIMPVQHLLAMADPHVKILILGYKNFGRGAEYRFPLLSSRQNYMVLELEKIMKSFGVVSFDNLAIEQLAPQRYLSARDWERMYMGDNGSFTMYIDLVQKEFAVSSTSKERYPLLADIRAMFAVVRQAAEEVA